MIPVISKSRGFKSRDFPDETWLKKHDLNFIQHYFINSNLRMSSKRM